MSSVFHAIGSAFDSIAHAIGHAFDQIYHVLKDAVMSLLDFIRRTLSRFWHFLTHNVVVIAIVVVIAAVVITIFAPELWGPIMDGLEYAAETAIVDVEAFGSWLLQAWQGISAWYGSTIGPYIVDALKTVQTVQTASQMYYDFKDHKYIDGLTVLFTEVLPNLTHEFDSKIQAVIDDVSKTFNTYQKVISRAQTTISEFGAGLNTLGEDVVSIGHNFGAKGITDIGDSIQTFVQNKIDGAINELNKITSDMNAAFQVAMSPFINFDLQYHALITSQEQTQRQLGGLTLAGLNGVTSSKSLKPWNLSASGPIWEQIEQWRKKIAAMTPL